MTIRSIRGTAPDGLHPSQIEVAGDAPAVEKVRVSLEVTGRERTRTVHVRKDGTWTGRFDADVSSLRGFACDALIAVRVESTDGAPGHAEWKGCLECGPEGEGPSGDGATPDPRPDRAGREPESPRSDATDGGDPAVLLLEEGPILVVRRASDGGPDAPTTTQAETVTRTEPQTAPDEAPPEPPDHGTDARQAPRHATPSASEDEAPSEAEARDDDESTPWLSGGTLVLAEAAVIVALAAQTYPVPVGLAAGAAVALTALFAAHHGARAWGLWSVSGVALGAVVTVALLPLASFVALDACLLAAALAAAGMGSAAGAALFMGRDEDE